MLMRGGTPGPPSRPAVAEAAIPQRREGRRCTPVAPSAAVRTRHRCRPRWAARHSLQLRQLVARRLAAANRRRCRCYSRCSPTGHARCSSLAGRRAQTAPRRPRPGSAVRRAGDARVSGHKARLAEPARAPRTRWSNSSCRKSHARGSALSPTHARLRALGRRRNDACDLLPHLPGRRLYVGDGAGDHVPPALLLRHGARQLAGERVSRGPAGCHMPT
jgi:hypothetical protein